MFPAIRAVLFFVLASLPTILLGQTKPKLVIGNEPYGDGGKIVEMIPSELPKVLDTTAVRQPIETTLCELAKDPERFNGKMVQFRASLVGHREITLEDFTNPEGCPAYMSVVLEFPANVKPSPNFALERDSSFRQYEAALRERVTIQATLNDVSMEYSSGRTKSDVELGLAQALV
jgi:hypothetical protein